MFSSGNPMLEGEISFGRFRLDPVRRELRRDGTLLRLGSRAADILCVLASAAGGVVTKDELMARVWPGLVVEENNLQVQIRALRKALEAKALPVKRRPFHGTRVGNQCFLARRQAVSDRLPNQIWVLDFDKGETARHRATQPSFVSHVVL